MDYKDPSNNLEPQESFGKSAIITQFFQDIIS